MNIEKIISKIIGVILIIILVKVAFGILFSTSEQIQKILKKDLEDQSTANRNNEANNQ